MEAAIRVQALARNSAQPILTAIGTAANRRLRKQEVFVPVPLRTHKTWLKIIAGERFSQVTIVPANEVRRPCAATDRKAHFLQIIFDVAIALGTVSLRYSSAILENPEIAKASFLAQFEKNDVETLAKILSVLKRWTTFYKSQLSATTRPLQPSVCEQLLAQFVGLVFGPCS